MMNRELSKGWRGWFAMYEEKMRKLQSMKRRSSTWSTVSRRPDGTPGRDGGDEEGILPAAAQGAQLHDESEFALGYAGWKEGWLHRVGRGIAASSMSRALSYFVNRELSRGWVGWRDVRGACTSVHRFGAG